MIVATESQQGALDTHITTIGLVIAKNVFQVVPSENLIRTVRNRATSADYDKRGGLLRLVDRGPAGQVNAAQEELDFRGKQRFHGGLASLRRSFDLQLEERTRHEQPISYRQP